MSTLRCGTATRDITPPYPSALHGYADRDHKSEGVVEPISLGCLALDDGDSRLLIVTCDMIGIESHICEELYALLETETGVGYPNILLSCSHTHFAPALHPGESYSPRVGIVKPDPRFVDDFKVKLVEVARDSLRNLQPGRLESARLHAPQVLFNRRTVRSDGSVATNFRYPLDAENYTISPTDDELTVLRIVDDSGVKATLANFGCHPVTGGQEAQTAHYRISADYPFYLRQTIAARWNCPVFFTLGSAGDAVPIDRYTDCRQRIGQTLGNTATLADRLFSEDPTPTVAADCRQLEVCTIIEADLETAEAEYTQARQRYLSLLDADPESPESREAAGAFQRQQTILHRARLYPDNQYTIKVQFLRIGGTTLTCLPFEVLSEISLRMKERFPHSALVSCAGGYQGYLPLEYEYARGGYEASERSTHFAKGTADRLLDLILDQLEKNDPER
jgi:neutral ceramidase